MSAADINPQAWIDGFKKENARVREHAGRSSKNQEQAMHITQATAAASAAIAEGRLLVTPALATQILSNHRYLRQRRVERTHVEALAHEMRSGVMIAGTQIAFGRLPAGSLHLVNGQHRLEAVVTANLGIEFQVAILDARDEEELHALYWRFDAVQRKRSGEMIVRAADLAERYQVQHGTARAAYDAGVIIACGLKRVPGVKLPPKFKTPDGRLAAIAPHWPQVKQYNDIISVAERDLKPRLLNGSVMAVAILTLRDQKELATQFWAGVAANSGLEKGDARRALVKALLNREMFTPDTGILLCANGWNAWHSRRRADYLKINNGVEPKLRGVRIP